ncbi:hypothetical protein HH310_37865 [Actinoplanes sp. TBRC 11911]|uniref:hypothetical protein n=1 Tax=Actinoplanes sp. TBRC 11911 TaxID=2729386 RepID=UPI00145DE692|nr:hypothetical protein [Actinoplanes sp. TBRC 11911]NMO56929.1 hypothetical protein [Actinoplanes sp. TBRC 11911]
MADFAPALGPAPLVLDLTVPGARMDETDAAAVAALAAVTEPVALWRAWRLPGRRRVYLLDAADAEPLRAAVGDADVELLGKPPTPDQRAARGRSALLWAARPAEPLTVARVFDSYDPVLGGQFTVDHPVLSAELAPVLSYLDTGAVVLTTTKREPDVFDEDAGPVVPMTFRTDGRWIWTDAVAYYLRTYALSPDADLLASLTAREYRMPEVDAVALHRALARLVASEGTA